MVITLLDLGLSVLSSLWIGSRLPFIDIRYRELVAVGWTLLVIGIGILGGQ